MRRIHSYSIKPFPKQQESLCNEIFLTSFLSLTE